MYLFVWTGFCLVWCVVVCVISIPNIVGKRYFHKLRMRERDKDSWNQWKFILSIWIPFSHHHQFMKLMVCFVWGKQLEYNPSMTAACKIKLQDRVSSLELVCPIQPTDHHWWESKRRILREHRVSLCLLCEQTRCK